MKTRSTIFQFNRKYFVTGLLLLATEILIARYARDRIIRPYGGDFLVVILLYAILRCFTQLSIKMTCIYVLLFSYGIEILQYFNFAERLGFRYGSVPFILLGNYFTWADIFCYTLGIGTVAVFERIIQSGGRQKKLLL
jgi:Protein of unknown function (DUF2809)